MTSTPYSASTWLARGPEDDFSPSNTELKNDQFFRSSAVLSRHNLA